MLENYQEFNAAMAIAAGKNEEELTRLGMSRPVEFVCNEVADAYLTESTAQFGSNSGKIVMKNEEDAAKFFRGGRWNRKQESPNNNAAQIAGEGK